MLRKGVVPKLWNDSPGTYKVPTSAASSWLTLSPSVMPFFSSATMDF